MSESPDNSNSTASAEAASGQSALSEELAFESAVVLAERVRKRELSAVELVDATLRRIARANPQVAAYLTIAAERAGAEAAAADRVTMSGADLGPLHGVPFSVKDLEETEGLRTTFGSPIYRDNVPQEDSIGVSRLRRAGAVLIGKTNTPEFGLLGETKNLLGNDTRNPWDLRCMVGGSSGGAAAAVAAGLGPLAIGSDGAGSITSPSSFCGVFGLKPSTGRIPSRPLPGTSLMFVSTGPITRYTADAALMLSIMSGHDERDPISMRESLGALEAQMSHPPAGLKVAWTRDLGHFPVDAEVESTCKAALDVFVDAGWSVEEETPRIPNPWDIYMPLFQAEEWVSLGALAERSADQFHPEALAEVVPGRNVTVADYVHAFHGLQHFRSALRTFFTQYDLLVLPTTAVPAFAAGRAPATIGGVPVEPGWMTFMPFPVTWNMTDQPVCSVPCGFSAAGLPIGLMIVAPVGREDLVLAAARAMETRRPWAGVRPPLAPRIPTRVRDEAVWV